MQRIYRYVRTVANVMREDQVNKPVIETLT